MNKYIAKLKESSELRNKMVLNFETGFWYEKTGMLTHLTDSDYESPNVFIDLKNTELFWDGWDPVFKVVSVVRKKFMDEKLVHEQTFLAIFDGDTYFTIPGKLVKKEFS